MGGSATELLTRLGDIADEAVRGSQSWPKRADTLSNRLVEHAPLLRQHGIEIQRGREAGGKRKRFLRVTIDRDAGGRLMWRCSGQLSGSGARDFFDVGIA